MSCSLHNKENVRNTFCILWTSRKHKGAGGCDLNDKEQNVYG